MTQNFLQLQLERTRFDRALEVVQELIDKKAFLNSSELARLNNILVGSNSEPWRAEPTSIQLPSGTKHQFQVLSDPVTLCKDIIKRAKDRAARGDVIEAASELYAELVLNHVFNDANRRTAVLAAAYLLRFYKYEVSAMALHELGLGDLRVEKQRESLKLLLRTLVEFKK